MMLNREKITFRPESEEDVEFLYRLYASTRTEELAVVPWSDEQKEAFLRQQFGAQRAHYLQHYDHADYSLILEDGQPIGRLYQNHLPDDVRIMDIVLMPEHRRRGIGRVLVQEVLDAARRDGKTVSIHVEAYNPALHLYESVGFRQIETNGPYLLLQWKPEEQGS
jgi:ribosomal protein S18 acetylase RimI-like enzyme